jgi:two-component system, OmpR family, response regulator BaeR
MNQSILIVEDESRIAALLSDYLKLAGFATCVIDNGNDVLPWVESNHPDLILLDLMLPGASGEKICTDLRARNFVAPIIMMTAKVEEENRILGLELGADDYMCKPLSPREVVARVKAALRRSTLASAEMPHELKLDESRMQVELNRKVALLTYVEFLLLKTLAQNPGRIYSRDHLMGCIYKDHRVGNDRTVDAHVKKLRLKMRKLFADADVIQSVYGVGYRYQPLEPGQV